MPTSAAKPTILRKVDPYQQTNNSHPNETFLEGGRHAPVWRNPIMRAFGFHRSPSFRCFFRNFAAGLLLLAVQMLPCAFAQTELATVLGRVTDPSGAVVAGAEVEIKNVETNLRVMSETNGDG